MNENCSAVQAGNERIARGMEGCGPASITRDVLEKGPRNSERQHKVGCVLNQ